jgi:thiol-disulfide isomerase/thioredoxin
MKYHIILFLILINGFTAYGQSKGKPVQITGHADFLHDGDTVRLIIYKYGFTAMEPVFQTKLIAITKQQSYQFDIPLVNHTELISILYKASANSLNEYFIEPGDKINLNTINDHFTISGAGSNDFKLQYQLRQIHNSYTKAHRNPELTPENLESNFENYDLIGKQQKAFLAAHKNEVSTAALNMLTTQIYSANKWIQYDDLLYRIDPAHQAFSDSLLQSFKHYLKNNKQAILKPEFADWYSDTYVDYLLKKFQIDFYVNKRHEPDITDCLKYVIDTYDGNAKEQLSLTLLSNSKQFPPELRPLIKQLLPDIKNPTYRNYLLNLAHTRIEGAKAYDFALIDTEGKTVHLSDFKGKVVVLDFWFTGCLGCKQLAPFMQKMEQHYKNSPVIFVSISADKNKNQWLQSVKGGTYVSPEITNLFCGGAAQEIPVISAYKVSAYPSLVIITPGGAIRNVPTDPRVDNGAMMAKLIEQNSK